MSKDCKETRTHGNVCIKWGEYEHVSGLSFSVSETVF